MTKGQKIGLGVGVGALALLAIGGAANAAGGTGNIEVPPPPREPDCPRGFHRETPGGPCVADPLPPPPTRKVKDYVGSGYNWPRRDLFPTEASFVQAWDTLGYQVDPSWDVLSGNFMQQVGFFQSDYNLVRQYLNKPVNALVVDRLIGKNTIGALVNVEAWENETGLDWGHLVNEARIALN